jgi:cytochrome c-type biogenesis protein CcmH
MKKIIFFIFLLNLVCSAPQAAVTERYPFNTPAQQTQFDYLTQQFRCLVCQNETLADSDAALAQDLRAQIAKRILTGASNADITQYLTQRYGDFVLFRPPFKKITWLLWLGPFLLLAGGVLIMLVLLRRYRLPKSP